MEGKKKVRLSGGIAQRRTQGPAKPTHPTPRFRMSTVIVGFVGDSISWCRFFGERLFPQKIMESFCCLPSQ